MIQPSFILCTLINTRSLEILKNPPKKPNWEVILLTVTEIQMFTPGNKADYALWSICLNTGEHDEHVWMHLSSEPPDYDWRPSAAVISAVKSHVTSRPVEHIVIQELSTLQ